MSWQDFLLQRFAMCAAWGALQEGRSSLLLSRRRIYGSAIAGGNITLQIDRTLYVEAATGAAPRVMSCSSRCEEASHGVSVRWQ